MNFSTMFIKMHFFLARMLLRNGRHSRQLRQHIEVGMRTNPRRWALSAIFTDDTTYSPSAGQKKTTQLCVLINLAATLRRPHDECPTDGASRARFGLT